MTDDSEEDAFDAVDGDEFDGGDVIEVATVVPDPRTPLRSLAARRAIEARREAREMQAALDYLELDIEDEE